MIRFGKSCAKGKLPDSGWPHEDGAARTFPSIQETESKTGTDTQSSQTRQAESTASPVSQAEAWDI
jgi:hypothetical protein